MTKNRLEAFSDGVLAILITIMVLELRPPHGTEWSDLARMTPKFLTYVLSFIFLGIYWNNHHHMVHLATRINGRVLWANLHLMLWLSFVPFVTAWMGENGFSCIPTACYGIVLLLAAISYTLLARTLIAAEGAHSGLKKAIGGDFKGYVSLALYALAIPLAFVKPFLAHALYVTVALIWFVPDLRIERHLER